MCVITSLSSVFKFSLKRRVKGKGEKNRSTELPE